MSASPASARDLIPDRESLYHVPDDKPTMSPASSLHEESPWNAPVHQPWPATDFFTLHEAVLRPAPEDAPLESLTALKPTVRDLLESTLPFPAPRTDFSSPELEPPFSLSYLDSLSICQDASDYPFLDPLDPLESMSDHKSNSPPPDTSCEADTLPEDLPVPGQTDSKRGSFARSQTGCSCKKSACLKLYCECFLSGGSCGDSCKCVGCKNTPGNDKSKALFLATLMTRRPGMKKGNPVALRESEEVTCVCRRSGCQQLYCECLKRGKACGAQCRCINCENGTCGKEVSASAMIFPVHGSQGTLKRVKRTSDNLF